VVDAKFQRSDPGAVEHCLWEAGAEVQIAEIHALRDGKPGLGIGGIGAQAAGSVTSHEGRIGTPARAQRAEPVPLLPERCALAFFALQVSLSKESH
jgi:hypothetical protein